MEALSIYEDYLDFHQSLQAVSITTELLMGIVPIKDLMIEHFVLPYNNRANTNFLGVFPISLRP